MFEYFTHKNRNNAGNIKNYLHLLQWSSK